MEGSSGACLGARGSSKFKAEIKWISLELKYLSSQSVGRCNGPSEESSTNKFTSKTLNFFKFSAVCLAKSSKSA